MTTLRIDYSNGTKTIKVKDTEVSLYRKLGYYGVTDKLNFSNKEEENNDWMSRFGN